MGETSPPPKHAWIKPWPVSHRLTAVTCDHEIITDNTWYKWLYVCFGAFCSHKNCYVIFVKFPRLGLLSSPYFAHDASCVMLNIDWTPLVGSKCNLKMHVRNLEYPFPLKIGGPKTTFWSRLRNLKATLTAYIFGK